MTAIDPSCLPPDNKRVIKIGQEEIVLDPDRLAFNESSLNEFQDRLALWYDYFGEKFCILDYLSSCAKENYETTYARLYLGKKEEGSTEKQAEAFAKSHEEVEEAKKKWIKAKLRRDQVEKHLKSWDRAHENAMNRGHMIRKEMDKLGTEIFFKNKDLASKVDEIVGGN